MTRPPWGRPRQMPGGTGALPAIHEGSKGHWWVRTRVGEYFPPLERSVCTLDPIPLNCFVAVSIARGSRPRLFLPGYTSWLALGFRFQRAGAGLRERMVCGEGKRACVVGPLSWASSDACTPRGPGGVDRAVGHCGAVVGERCAAPVRGCKHSGPLTLMDSFGGERAGTCWVAMAIDACWARGRGCGVENRDRTSAALLLRAPPSPPPRSPGTTPASTGSWSRTGGRPGRSPPPPTSRRRQLQPFDGRGTGQELLPWGPLFWRLQAGPCLIEGDAGGSPWQHLKQKRSRQSDKDQQPYGGLPFIYVDTGKVYPPCTPSHASANPLQPSERHLAFLNRRQSYAGSVIWR